MWIRRADSANALLSTKEKFIYVSRPRRFGKSMTLEMLAAYYTRGCDSAELFKGCRIEKEETFKEHLNQYDVIFLNMQHFLVHRIINFWYINAG